MNSSDAHINKDFWICAYIRFNQIKCPLFNVFYLSLISRAIDIKNISLVFSNLSLRLTGIYFEC